MSCPSGNSRDRQPGRHVPEPAELPQGTDRPLADSLKRIVRRVLRTQSSRTSFETRVLEESRRLLDGCGIARETLERLVVDRLLGNRQEARLEVGGQGAGALCPPTQLSLSNSTFTRHSAADISPR